MKCEATYVTQISLFYKIITNPLKTSVNATKKKQSFTELVEYCLEEAGFLIILDGWSLLHSDNSRASGHLSMTEKSQVIDFQTIFSDFETLCSATVANSTRLSTVQCKTNNKTILQMLSGPGQLCNYCSCIFTSWGNRVQYFFLCAPTLTSPLGHSPWSPLQRDCWLSSAVWSEIQTKKHQINLSAADCSDSYRRPFPLIFEQSAVFNTICQWSTGCWGYSIMSTCCYLKQSCHLIENSKYCHRLFTSKHS